MKKFEQSDRNQLKETDCLLFFSARWCGTCRAVIRAFDEQSKILQVPIYLIDIEAFPEIKNHYSVKGVPVLIYQEKGNEINRVAGSFTSEELAHWLEEMSLLKEHV